MPGSGRWEPLGLRRTGRRVNSRYLRATLRTLWPHRNAYFASLHT